MKKIYTIIFAGVLILCVSVYGQDNTALSGSAGIESLFGVHNPEADEAADAVRALPPFHGNYRILIARPIYALYDAAEGGTKWISAMAEIYAYYKAASFPRTHVFSMEEVDYVLPNSRDYNRRFSRQAIINAAKRLDATHIIFQEYQPVENAEEARYVMELFWIQEDAAVVRPSGIVAYSSFENGLDTLLGKIAGAMDPEAGNTTAFRLSIMGSDRGVIERFGNILANEGEFTKKRAVETYSAAAESVQNNPRLIAMQYGAALLAGRAENYRQAINHINAVIDRSGGYPALNLRLAEYLRGAERYREAERAVEAASHAGALHVPALMERAMILQAGGDTTGARAVYETIIKSRGAANAVVYFRAALLAARSGDVKGCEEIINRAVISGLDLSGDEYYELGAAVGNIPGHEKVAVKYLKMSLGPAQSGERAWLAIAGVYRRSGSRELEAGIYVNLFRSNMKAHSGRLKAAGQIYENLGLIDKAKEAYTLFWEKGFIDLEVSMSLARILVNERECKNLWNVLSLHPVTPEVAQLLGECGLRRAAVASRVEIKETHPAMLTMRISGGALAALGLAGGLYYNANVKAEAKNYNGFGSPLYPKGTDAEYYAKVQKMRKNIDNAALRRNMLYIVSGVGAGLFTVSFFF